MMMTTLLTCDILETCLYSHLLCMHFITVKLWTHTLHYYLCINMQNVIESCQNVIIENL